MKTKKSKPNKIWIMILVLVMCIAGGFAGYFLSGHFKQKTVSVDTRRTAQPSTDTDLQNSGDGQVSNSRLSEVGQSNNEQQVVAEVYKAFARFYGEVDAHTVQLLLINTDFNYKEFEIGDGFISSLNLSEGEIIEIEFKKPQDGGNPKIVSIKKPDKVTLKGKFVGLADNNFAEFVFDSKHIVFQISNVADKIAYLAENTDVEVTFKTNPQSSQSNPVVEDVKPLR
uniref:Uncharacterized protein n=1 Tax=Caldicellulosiruptor owensensis TaxID=55205 RepID=A0A7C5V352_9FIRM